MNPSSPEPHPDPKLEAALHRRPDGKLPAAARAALKDEIFAGATVAGKTPVQLFMWLLVAAVILCVAGGAWWKLHQPETTMTTPLANAVAVVSAQDEFVVLHADPATPAALVQSFDTFNVATRQPGEPVGKYTLRGVTADTLQVEDTAGIARELVIATQNKQARQRLAEEIASLQAAHSLSAGELARVGKIAMCGDATALRMLEILAGSGAQAEAARQLLAVNQQVQTIRRLIEKAHSDNADTANQALRVLAETASPLALQCLKEVTLGGDARRGLFIMQLLAEHPAECLLPAVAEIATTAQDEAVRAAAQQLLEQQTAMQVEQRKHAK